MRCTAYVLDDAALEDLKEALIDGQRLAVDEDARVLVWMGETASAAPLASVRVPAPDDSPGTRTPLLHPTARGGQNPDLPQRPRRRAQAGDRAVCRPQKFDRADPRPQCGSRPAALRSGGARHDGRRAPLRGHRQPGARGRYHGALRHPMAHEDHAVWACYAPLAMQAAIRRYAEEVRRSHGLEMQARVWLNSGEVVVRAIGNDLHMDYSAVGQTTHLAVHMEQLATPVRIRLTATTLRLAEGLVQVKALGWFPVKGLTEPVEVCELVGASTIRRRLQASAARGLTRFVGRQQELMALQQALERAGAGHGQVAALVGEAGVGKSRLVYEFVHSHYTPGWSV